MKILEQPMEKFFKQMTRNHIVNADGKNIDLTLLLKGVWTLHIKALLDACIVTAQCRQK